MRYIGWGITIISILVALACSKSTKPDGEIGYSLIVGDLGQRQMAVIIDPESKAILDSIPLPYGAKGFVYTMQAHPLQDELLIGAADNGVLVYELSTQELVGRIPHTGGVGLLEVGKKVFIGSVDSLRFFELPSLSQIDADTALLWYPRVVPGGTLLAGDAPSSPPSHWTGVMAFYDLMTGWYDTLSIPGGFAAAQVFPFPDGRHVLAIGYQGNGRMLFLIDPQSRTVSTVASLTPLSVWFNVVFSTSGEIAYVAASQDPDDPDVFGCSVGEIVVLSAAAGDLPTVINRIPFDSPVVDLALSPNGELLYCAAVRDGCSGEVYGGKVIALNAHTMDPEDSFDGYLFPFQIEIGPAWIPNEK